ncbi:MAG: nodulation protein NfeD, partial [Dehalococcoidia bacterium]|nr:nodulation protein NfeD [Dehalococcoidia bacterium]
QRRGRNTEWVERAVRNAASAGSLEAVQLGVVEFIAPDLASLLRQADGRVVSTPSGPRTIDVANAPIADTPMDLIEQFLLVITNPTIAAFLLAVAGLAIYFELANPGAIVPGVIGGIALIVGLFALGTLPVNWAAFALIVFGFALFFFETVVNSQGILGVGGLVAIGLGMALLINSSAPYLQVSRPAIVGFLFALGAGLIVSTWLTWGTRRMAPKTGARSMIGAIAVAKEDLNPRGMVLLDGELWEAVSDTPVTAGSQVTVTGVSGLVVRVAPVAQSVATAKSR